MDRCYGGPRIRKRPRQKDLSWLTRIRACRLNRPLLLKFENLLESDEFLETLLCSSADNTTGYKNLPRYLNWVKTGEKEGFELTHFGKICCSHGISTKTCDELYEWLGTGVGDGKILEINAACFFRLLLCTSDGVLVRLLKTELSTVNQDFILKEYKSDLSEPPSRGDRDVTITCLALKDWIAGIPTIEIEKKYGLCYGSLYEVARQVSRLTRACRDIARKARGIFESEIQITINLTDSTDKYQIPDGLGDLAEMVLYGLPLEALPIAYLRVEGLTRSWTMNLVHVLDAQGIGEGLPQSDGLLRQSGWDIFSQYSTLTITAQRGGKGSNRNKIVSSLLKGWVESLIMLGARQDGSYVLDSSNPAHSCILALYSFHQRRSVLSSAAEGAWESLPPSHR